MKQHDGRMLSERGLAVLAPGDRPEMNAHVTARDRIADFIPHIENLLAPYPAGLDDSTDFCRLSED